MGLVEANLVVGIGCGGRGRAVHREYIGDVGIFYRVYFKHVITIVESDVESYRFEYWQGIQTAARFHSVLIIIGGLFGVEIELLGIRSVAVVAHFVPACNRFVVEDIYGHFGGILAVGVKILFFGIIADVVVPICVCTCGRTVYRAV